MYSSRLDPLGDEFGCASDWFALYTRHQHEKVIAWVLQNKGFETFLPLYTTVRCRKDRSKRLALPLFPCYVFLRGDLRRRLDIVTIPGVHNIVSTGGQPAAISEAEIDPIRQMIASKMGVEPHPFMRHGDRVRIKSGPLEGLEGILIRKKSLFRLVVSIEMLQKSVAVEVDASMVESTARHDLREVAEWMPRNVPVYP
jgi:transcription antitermination factor NusG